MITEYLKAPPFAYITIIVETQLCIALILSVFILVLLVHRNSKKIRLESLKADYANALIGQMLEYFETGKTSKTFRAPGWLQFGKREVLKNVFLDYFKSVSGPEKVFLSSKYDEFRFTNEDLNGAISFFWWRRLRAISNLSLMGSERLAPLFHKLTSDRNELVAASAYIALSGYNHHLNKPQLVSQLPSAVIKRKNVMHEILKNWSSIYGPAFLVEQIQAVRDPMLLSILVNAVSTLLSPEVAEVYTKVLVSPREVPVEVVEQMLVLLKNVGDPACAPAARKYMNHPEEIVRLRALDCLVAVGENDVLHLSSVLTDSSVILQRWLKTVAKERAA